MGGTPRVHPRVNLEGELCSPPPLQPSLLLRTVWHLLEQLGYKSRRPRRGSFLLKGGPELWRGKAWLWFLGERLEGKEEGISVPLQRWQGLPGTS